LSKFMFVVIALALTGEFLAEMGLPRVFRFSTELSAAVLSFCIVVLAAKRGFVPVRPAYWIMFLLIGLHLLFGIVANEVQLGTVIISARYYLGIMPFFVLPLVVPPTERDLKIQFGLIVCLGLIQLPFALQQRMATIAVGNLSGDNTIGTLMNSGLLSVFLICLAAVVFTVYLRGKLRLAATVPILLIILLPTMINETKGSLFLIPFAFFVPVLARPSTNLAKNLTVAAISCAAFFALYVPIYNSFLESRSGGGIVEFLTSEDRLVYYLKKDAEVGTTGPVGRIDKLVLPIRVLGTDPVLITLGLGMGAVTQSSLGPQYEGEYVSKYGDLVGGTISRLFWEIGWLGLVLVNVFLALIFLDSWKMRHRTDTTGLFAQAWVAVLAVMAVGMFYKNVMSSSAISMLFWYYCGVVVANAAQGAQPQQLAQGERVNFNQVKGTG